MPLNLKIQIKWIIFQENVKGIDSQGVRIPKQTENLKVNINNSQNVSIKRRLGPDHFMEKDYSTFKKQSCQC